MSMMKRILEVIEADEELKTTYESTLDVFDRNSDEYVEVMKWIYDEALDQIEN